MDARSPTRTQISPTITHAVRVFLRRYGAPMKPWSSQDETYRALYRLLHARRDDPDFWEPLGELLRAVLRSTSAAVRERLPAPDAELLDSWDVEQLLAEIRAGLRGAATPEPSVVRFASRLSVPAMGAFLLLGLIAAGCGPGGVRGEGHEETNGPTASGSSGGDGDGDGDAGGDGDGDGDASGDGDGDGDGTGDGDGDGDGDGGPRFDLGGDGDGDGDGDGLPDWADGCTLDPESLLFQTIAESAHEDWAKQTLCYCLAGLNADWNEGLTELFATRTPEEIAAALNEMLECCEWDTTTFEQDFLQSKDDLLSGELCFVAPPYRGVTFAGEP